MENSSKIKHLAEKIYFMNSGIHTDRRQVWDAMAREDSIVLVKKLDLDIRKIKIIPLKAL